MAEYQDSRISGKRIEGGRKGNALEVRCILKIACRAVALAAMRRSGLARLGGFAELRI